MPLGTNFKWLVWILAKHEEMIPVPVSGSSEDGGFLLFVCENEGYSFSVEFIQVHAAIV